MGLIIPHIDFKYRSEASQHFDRDSWLSGAWETDSAVFVNARVTWQFPDDRTELAIWGQNLTDKDEQLIGGVPLAGITGGGGQVFHEPRTFGIDLNYRFGER